MQRTTQELDSAQPAGPASNAGQTAVGGLLRTVWVVCAFLLVLPLPVAAQLKYGDLTASSSGNISSGYTATYGNQTSSAHGWAVGGTGDFSGAFYNPNFLSYNASVYLNQSRANSDYQSISSASGFTVSSSLFAGSKFPGSINYSKAFNSDGNFAVPGLANYVTHGNNDNFGVNWSEILPNMPSFSAGYQRGSGEYTVYGSNDDGKNRFQSLNLHSGYTAAGFNIGLYYVKGSGYSEIPQTITNGIASSIQNGTSGYGVNVSHPLPLSGSFSFGANRTTYNTNYLDTTSNGNIDLVNALVGLHPSSRLSLSFTTSYSDNLNGQLIEQVLSSGGAVVGSKSSSSSNSLDLMGVAAYTPAPNIQTSVFIERRSQEYEGTQYGVNSYGGSASYAHKLFDGAFNVAATATANTSDSTGQDTLGFSANENYANVLLGWQITESLGYSQNVQTLLVTYTNSFYNYSANAHRRWGQFNVGMGTGGARTALTQNAGTNNMSQSYMATMGYGRWVTANGNYSNSSGQALVTGSGLVVITPPTTSSTAMSLFGGNSYSFGLASSPAKRLTLAANYSKSISNTSTDATSSRNHNIEFNSLIQYQFRKLYFTSGYARLEQGFSTTGTQPEIVSSYYMGISRWFNFF
ncbi:MAG: hypothetical protein P4L40_05955 [Terracidiphilus sp.]|nr:hypothetical protein [Terracidiphilus sp.]